jgi:hypothetical protein
MGTPWPPPSADELDETSGAYRQPNFLLRRAVVGIVVVALAAGGLWFALGRGGDEESSASTVGRGWNTVVVQRSDGTLTIHDRDGQEVATAETDLLGVTDVGLDGAVLLGLGGDPATDGLGVLTLDDGSITELEVGSDELRALAGTPLLVAHDATGTALELVDPGRGSTLDLLDLADGDAPLSDVTTVRASDDAAFVAFNELRNFETVVVDVAAGTGVTVPGSLVDLGFGRVLTMTNRGATVLLDVSDTTGERIGTVETVRPAAIMLVSSDRAVAVSATGVVSTIDFSDESVDEVTQLATVLPVPPGTDVATDPEIVLGGIGLTGHTRLALFGERFVAFVDEAGSLVRSIDVPAQVQVFLDPGPAQRCLAVGQASGPYTLLDAEDGVIVTSFDDGVLVGDSDDGCVVAFQGSGTRGVVAGLDLDQRLEATVRALSADGSAVVQANTRDASIVDLESGEETELVTEDEPATGVRVIAAAFGTR